MEALNVSVRPAKHGATPLVGTPASSFALSEVVKALLDTAMWGERSRLETDVRAHVDKGVEGSHHHRPLSGCCREGGHLLLPVESLRGGPLHWTTVGGNKPL